MARSSRRLVRVAPTPPKIADRDGLGDRVGWLGDEAGCRVWLRLGLSRSLEAAPSLDLVERLARRVVVLGDVSDVVGFEGRAARSRLGGDLHDRRAL